MSARYAHLSSVELRLDLAEAQYERPGTLRGIVLKRNRIRDLTGELVRRGSF